MFQGTSFLETAPFIFVVMVQLFGTVCQISRISYLGPIVGLFYFDQVDISLAISLPETAHFVLW